MRRCTVIIEGLLVAFVVGIGLLFVAGGALLIKGLGGHLWERWGAYFAAHASQRWVATTGKVTRSVVTYTTFRRGKIYAPVVRYAYSVGGESFVSERFAFVVTESGGDEGAAAARAVVDRFRAGTDVEVFYDPEKPKRATLDRSVPSVMSSTLGWLLVTVVGAGLMLPIGVAIVRGPFEDPPDLGDVPSLSAQLGGLGAAVGVIFLLVGGVRIASAVERKHRRLRRQLESAKPSLIHEVRAGELVSVSGRAEELEGSLDAFGGDDDGLDPADEEILDENADEVEHPSATELRFEDAPLVYYDVDVEWFRRTCFTPFGVRDASGVVPVELHAPESTLLKSQRLRIEGKVERWLDETRDASGDPISAQPEWLRFERIRKGDQVLLVGRAEREDGELVFRAGAGESTLVADGTREEIVERLNQRLGKTRAMLLLGGGLIALGALAMTVPFP